MHTTRNTLLAATICLLAACGPAPTPSSVDASADTSAPVFDETFWSHWGDGQAELAG